VQPVADPVVGVVDPVVEPVLQPVQQTVVEPLVEPVVEPAADVVAGPAADPVLQPVQQTAAQTPYATGAAPARQSGPFAAATHEPGRTIARAPVDGSTSGGVISPGSAPAAGGHAGDPGVLPPSSPRAPLDGQRAPPAAPDTGAARAGVSPSPLAGLRPSARDLSAASAAAIAGAAGGASRAAPGRPSAPSPFTGAPLTAPASGGSGGPAPGSGGGAPDHPSAALAALLAAALAGRFLWHARDLLRPASFFGPIVNEPS
jgi:hypothetical protein